MSSLIGWITSFYYQDPLSWENVCNSPQSAIESIRGSMPFERSWNNDEYRFQTCKVQLVNYLKESDAILLRIDKRLTPGYEEYISRVERLKFQTINNNQSSPITRRLDHRSECVLVDEFNQLSQEICNYYVDQLRYLH